MPDIKITDQLGISLDAQLGPASAWLTHARNLAEVALSGASIQQLQILKLADPAFQSLNVGLAFKQPVALGKDAPQLTIGADAGASFRVLRRTGEKAMLFAPDDLGENLEIQAGTCYAAIGFHANVNANVNAGSQLSFGVAAGGGLAIESFRPFSAGDDGPTILEALRVSIGEFILPESADDLNALPTGAIVTIKGTGRLKFSGKANLLAVANPLATAALPSPLPALSVNQSASVTIGASWELDSEYQVRAHKIADGRVRLAWYPKRESDFDVSASASVGISTEAAGTDLFPRLIQAISPDAKADLSAMSPEHARECEKAVTDAVNRNLQISLEAQLGALRSDEAMFLYDIDCAALNDSAKSILADALKGDLSGIGSAAGVTEIRSIDTRMRESHFTMKVNLLGIFNFGSVSRLALESKVTFTDSTGDLLIVDRASAERIELTALNVGPKEEKLRKLMAESFLITAAYRGSRLVLSPPTLASSHMFFRLYAKAGQDDVRGGAAIAAALKLRGPEILPEIEDFGRTSVCAETRYDDALSHALFLRPDGTLRSHAEYEAAGRKAVQLLVQPDGDDRFRLGPATDDRLWARMKDLGPANFQQLFPQLQAAVIGADYLAIQWWADTMCRTGAILARIGAEPQLREELARDLRDVAGRSHEQFGKPWGLVAMFLAGGAAAPAEVRITGSRITFTTGTAIANSVG